MLLGVRTTPILRAATAWIKRRRMARTSAERDRTDQGMLLGLITSQIVSQLHNCHAIHYCALNDVYVFTINNGTTTIKLPCNSSVGWQ